MILYIGKLPSKKLDEKKLTTCIRHLAGEYVFSKHNTSRLLNVESYLNKYYHVNEPIREALLNIINGFVVGKVEDEYVATISDLRLDSLARIITYGNLDLQGSNILNKALDYAVFYL